MTTLTCIDYRNYLVTVLALVGSYADERAQDALYGCAMEADSGRWNRHIVAAWMEGA